MEELVEMDDVQGILFKGYARLESARYLLLHFTDTAKSKTWISTITKHVTAASTSSNNINNAVQIAFTCQGIKALNFSEEVIKTFPTEFVEGMVTPHRQRVLGDFEESDPNYWDWGGPYDPKPVHVLLMLFAKDEMEMQSLLHIHRTKWEAATIELLHELKTEKLPYQKEHFGFRDGIGQPVIKYAGRNESSHGANNLNPGEFLFGYKNEYDKYTYSPNVCAKEDPTNMLPADKNFPDKKDLGRNGSMMVFRQLHQDVKKFWEFIYNNSGNQTPEYLASKMVGRWPDGSPLTKCPVNPNENYSGYDNFGYAKNDYDGFKCPIGSHIRRSNPRDNFLRDSTGDPEKDREKSMIFTKRFRIIRRGRPFGKPLSPSMQSEDMLKSEINDTDRGMYFICFNSNIGRQFELISQTWVNNPKLAGLYEDPDPLVGYPGIMGEGATTTFTAPAKPVREKTYGIPRFVWAKGGAYFFMPGIKSLKYMGKK